MNGLPDLPPSVPKPCNDCPWRTNALPGWLGPHDVEEWLHVVHGESPIACHQTIPPGSGGRQETWLEPGIRQCAGAALFRLRVAKSPRNSQDARHQFRNSPLLDTVLADDDSFRRRHASAPKMPSLVELMKDDPMNPCNCEECDCDQIGFVDQGGLCDQCSDGDHADDRNADYIEGRNFPPLHPGVTGVE